MCRKNSFAEIRNEIAKDNAPKIAATEKQEELDKDFAKIKVFIEKRFVISDKIFSSVSLTLFELHEFLISYSVIFPKYRFRLF